MTKILDESNARVTRPVSETYSIINVGGFAFTNVFKSGLLEGLIVTFIVKLEVLFSNFAETVMKAWISWSKICFELIVK